MNIRALQSIALLVVTIYLLLMSFAASAVPVPGSNPSAMYAGEDRACLVVLSRSGDHIRTEITCLYYNGAPFITYASSNLYAPGVCRGDYAIAFSGQFPTEYVSLREYDPLSRTLRVIRGADQLSVTNGIGHEEYWAVVTPIASNYGCAPRKGR